MRAVNRSLAIRPLPNRLHLSPGNRRRERWLLIAAVLVPAHPASAQRGGTTCSTAGAVSDAANNPGLVSDCDTLLAARDTLAGTATLNWSVSTPIDQWEGVTVVRDSPPRVTELILPEKGLTGEIPAELGGLSNLEELILIENHLTGRIPTELGGLANLILLNLYGNQLSGEIPTELGSLGILQTSITTRTARYRRSWADLKPERVVLIEQPIDRPDSDRIGEPRQPGTACLSENQLTGTIPTALGGLSNLLELSLYNNQLTGQIPSELGGLINLQQLYLFENQLSGEIPAELGEPRQPGTSVPLYDNQLTG